MKITCSLWFLIAVFALPVNAMELDNENINEPCLHDNNNNDSDYTDFLARTFTYSVLPAQLQNVPPEYRCPYHNCCKRTPFNNKKLLCKHLNWYHKKRNSKFPCSFRGCTKQPDSTTNLANHLRTHTNQKPFTCTVEGCHAAFKQLGAVKFHMQATHATANFNDASPAPIENQTDEDDNAPMFLQSFLAYQFSSVYLPQSLQRDTMPRNYYYCPYRACHKFTTPTKNIFENKRELKAHLRQHRGSYRLPCPFTSCTQKPSSATDLATHLRTHIGHRPYKCPISGCNESFAKNLIAEHLKKHHNQ